MISYNTEYFGNNCYFYLRDRGGKISLYYSVGETLNESKKNDERQDFDKMDSKKLKSFMDKVLKSKKKYSKEQIKKMLKPKKSEKTKELDELVDEDGTMLSSRIPNLNQTLHPRDTLDQTVNQTRLPSNPVVRGMRFGWGEGTENKGHIVSEVDYSDAFGFEETEYQDYSDTVDTLEDMGVENSDERAKEFGKLPNQKVKKDEEGDPVLKQRLVEKGTLDEEQKKKMIKMVEDILTKKSKDKSDVVTKENPISKILVKNLNSIKKIADKEGISINQLIKILKTNE
jgi:hypothetical protein